MCIFGCNECKEKEEIIKSLHDERTKFYRENDDKIEKLKRELKDKDWEIRKLERHLEPYLEPRTKMLYKVKVDDTTYDVIADYYEAYHHLGRQKTEFFLGDRRVADFSKVDEVIGFRFDLIGEDEEE
jgi:hypothetical protein